MRSTNWLAVIVAAVAGMGIGFLWYGVVFQDQWMTGNGIQMVDEKFFKNGIEQASSSMPMLFNTIAMLIYGVFMDWLIHKTGDTSLGKGATLGFILGLVMVVGIFIGNMFSFNSNSLSIVDGSYSLVLFTAIGAIIGGGGEKNNNNKTRSNQKGSEFFRAFLLQCPLKTRDEHCHGLCQAYVLKIF